MFRRTIKLLKGEGWKVKILIKTKDVLESLVKESGFEYENILPGGRSHSKLAMLFAVVKRDIKLWKIVRKFKPDLMMGTDPSIAHVSWFTGRYGVTIVEDDEDVIKPLVRMTYPFTKAILCPKVCRVGDKYEHKKLGYSGYMKLGYLHPNVFQLSDEVIKKYSFDKKFVLIRLSSLGAYHDYGIGGLNKPLLREIIQKCQQKGYQVKLSAEFDLDSGLKKLQLQISKLDMHHVLAAASLLISDSQSMSVEAAMLGTPSIRYSGFAGRISVLEELEHKYQLTFGVKIGNTEYLFQLIEKFSTMSDLKQTFAKRREHMMAEKIDVSAFLVWLIGNFPQSINQIKTQPDFDERFISIRK